MKSFSFAQIAILAALAVTLPGRAHAQDEPAARARRFFAVSLIGGATPRNSLRTNGDRAPYSRTVYTATFRGQPYYSVGVAPALRWVGKVGTLTMEAPITYETTHAYHATRPLTSLSGQPWPDSIFSAATIRADYLTMAVGGRYALKVSRRVRPFLGGQVGFRVPSRIRENEFSQNPPAGWYYQGQFLRGQDGASGLGHLTAALLGGVELGMAKKRHIWLAVRTETGRHFELSDEIDPIWYATTILVGIAPWSWSAP